MLAAAPGEELGHGHQPLGLGAEGEWLAVALSVGEEGVLVGEELLQSHLLGLVDPEGRQEGEEIGQVATTALDGLEGVVVDLHPSQVLGGIRFDGGHYRLLHDGRQGGHSGSDLRRRLADLSARPPPSHDTKSCILCAVKPVVFVGGADEELRRFPAVARQRAGYQLYLVQMGDAPHDAKPMASVGPGCREIRVREASGAFRVFFVANMGRDVYVLHCFQKKSQRTPPAALAVGQRRYREMMEIVRAKGHT